MLEVPAFRGLNGRVVALEAVLILNGLFRWARLEHHLQCLTLVTG